SLFFLLPPPPPSSTLFPYTTLFRSSTSTLRPTPSAVLGLMPCTTWCILSVSVQNASSPKVSNRKMCCPSNSVRSIGELVGDAVQDRKSTRLNSSHVAISYAVFCLKK